MPFNIYTFVLSEKLASDEYAKRGVSDKDSVRRTALITGFLSPSNGGINGAVIPALFAKEKASRDADAAAVKPALQPATPGTPQEPPAPDQQGVDERLKAVESAFAPYTNFVGKTVGEAKPELEKNFTVVVKDDSGATIANPPLDTLVGAQQPDPKQATKLLKGVQVSLIVKKQ